MARSRGGESADPEVDPLADVPSPTGREGYETVSKEDDDASEGVGRASWVFCSGLVLAIVEDPRSNGVEKGR